MHHLAALYAYQFANESPLNSRCASAHCRKNRKPGTHQRRRCDGFISIQRSQCAGDDGQFRARTKERQLCQLHSYRYINYSNICVLSCQFCAFAARKRDPHAFEYASDEIIRAVAEALPLGITEVHMVGGLHPTLKKDWYLDLLRGLRALDPDLHIKAFTA